MFPVKSLYLMSIPRRNITNIETYLWVVVWPNGVDP